MMTIPILLDPLTNIQFLQETFRIECALAEAFVRMSGRLEFGISIISGFRSEAEQDELRREGFPAAPNDRSTHLSCPATGGDLWPDIAVTRPVKARLGAEGVFAGLRWGGGSAMDPDEAGIIPLDWNHFDLGPRN